MAIGFLFTRRGLKFAFTASPDPIPVGSTYHWDFGDESVAVGNPVTHIFPSVGTYEVKLSILDELGEAIDASNQTLEIHTRTVNTLPLLSISQSYIPGILLSMFEAKGEMLKDKWLLFLQPLVNHEVEESNYFDEAYYESLEIQLGGELVAYDFLLSEVTKNLIGAITSSTDTSGDNTSEVKKITTGPTDAEFFSDAESFAKMAKALSDLNKPGGIMDGLKVSICQLASRLDIYLPMCERPLRPIKDFKVARRNE